MDFASISVQLSEGPSGPAVGGTERAPVRFGAASIGGAASMELVVVVGVCGPVLVDCADGATVLSAERQCQPQRPDKNLYIYTHTHIYIYVCHAVVIQKKRSPEGDRHQAPPTHGKCE